MQAIDEFQIGNPGSVDSNLSRIDESVLVTEYATKIQYIRGRTAQLTLQLAAVIFEAIQRLSAGGQKDLAARVGMSPSTLSKYKKLHEQRARFESKVDVLPPEPSTLYALAKVPADVYQRMEDDELIRPDVTAKEVTIYAADNATGQTRSESAPGLLETLAILKCPSELREETRTACLSLVRSALQGEPVSVTQPQSAPRSKTAVRQALAFDFRNLLDAELASHKTGCSSVEYPALENAAWQHHHKTQKGSYPYAAEDPNSIEHPEHPYFLGGSFGTVEAFFQHLAERRIITPYNPISSVPGLERANCRPINIWDPSAGYGGRVYGALAASTDRPIRYIGTDPNTANWITPDLSRYAALADHYKLTMRQKYPSEVEVLCMGSETVHEHVEFQQLRGKLDLIFTSPPYFCAELYSREETQSAIKFPTYEAWRDGFLRQTLKTCAEWLRPGGYIVWNIADISHRGKYLPLEQDSCKALADFGLEYGDKLKMLVATVTGGGKLVDGLPTTKNYVRVNGCWRKYEPLFVFRKHLNQRS